MSLLYWELGYDQKQLPCPFPNQGCQGTCGCDHSGGSKAVECPLKANCPTPTTCLFGHNEMTTVQAYPAFATIAQDRSWQTSFPLRMEQTFCRWGQMCTRCGKPQQYCTCGGH
jgi:hypothetical protein